MATETIQNTLFANAQQNTLLTNAQHLSNTDHNFLRGPISLIADEDLSLSFRIYSDNNINICNININIYNAFCFSNNDVIKLVEHDEIYTDYVFISLQALFYITFINKPMICYLGNILPNKSYWDVVLQLRLSPIINNKIKILNDIRNSTCSSNDGIDRCKKQWYFTDNINIQLQGYMCRQCGNYLDTNLFRPKITNCTCYDKEKEKIQEFRKWSRKINSILENKYKMLNDIKLR